MTSNAHVVHHIGRVDMSFASTDIHLAEDTDSRQVRISRVSQIGPHRGRETAAALISQEAAGLLARVLYDIDDWDEVRALTKLLRAAGEYDGTETTED